MNVDATEPSGLRLRQGTDGDVADVAELHAAQITEGFLALLGPRFLRRLYRRIVRTHPSFLLVVDQHATTVGFLAGSTDVHGLYRSFLVHDGIPAGFAGGTRMVRSWRRVLETLRHGSDASGHGAELLSVAVRPDARGLGVGTLLVQGFLGEIAQRGVHAAHVVVAAHNEAAVALYERSGFEIAERFELHKGTESLLMQRDASPPAEQTSEC